MAKRTFTPEERQAYAEAKQRQREELETRVKDLVESFRDSDTFKTYLSQMSEFNRNCEAYLHRYSPNNLLFIVMQDPTAQLVGSASAWRKMGRYINKGETSHIQVWAPMKEAVMQNKLDENGNPILKPDGTPEREPVRDENGRVKRRFNGRFKLEPVFDISQTDGDPLPQLAHELKDPVEHFADYEKAIRDVSPFPIFYSNEKEVADLPLNGAKGICSYLDEKIVIKAGMSDMQTLKTMIHEVTHAKLHDPRALTNEANKEETSISRNEKEVQAECTAFLVCEHFGLDSSDYSIPYIMSWGEDKKLTPLTNSLDAILKASDEIIDQMETHLWVEMGIDETLKDASLEAQLQAAGFEGLTPAETQPTDIDLDRLLANKTVMALWELGFKLRYEEALLSDEAPSASLERTGPDGVARIDMQLFTDKDGYLVPNFQDAGTTTLSAFEPGAKEPYFQESEGNLIDQLRSLSNVNEERTSPIETAAHPEEKPSALAEQDVEPDERNDVSRSLLTEPTTVKLLEAGYTAEPQKIMTPDGYVSGLSLTKENELYKIHVDIIPPYSPIEGSSAIQILHPNTTALTVFDKRDEPVTKVFESWFDKPLQEQMADLRRNPHYQELCSLRASNLAKADLLQDPISYVKQKHQEKRTLAEEPNLPLSRSIEQQIKRTQTQER